MLVTLLLGAAIGGVVAFVWGAISWMAIPWHHATLREFQNDAAVSKAIVENAPVSGVYSLPGMKSCKTDGTPEEKKAAQAAAWEKMKGGPLVMAIVRREGFSSFPLYLVGSFLINVIAAFFVTGLLLHAPGLPYLGKAAFVGVAALVGAIACRGQDWNWHGYSTSYTAVGIADTFIGWFLVGLAIAPLMPT